MFARAASLLTGLFQNSPLRHRGFRMFYFGSVGVALGYTMQATLAAWLMATLTPSPLMVALVQTASNLPFLLFGLAAGALADIFERRRIVLVTQMVMLTATVVLGSITLAGLISPATLLAVTFVIGTGFTFYMPAQQASINDLVSRVELPRAVALGAVAFNVSRAGGPALAGAIAAWLSTGSALLASTPCFLVMIIAVRRWKSPPATPGIPESLFSGIQAGLRYTRHSPPLRALIVRSMSFGVCASALWALLPVIARDQLGLGAGGFGLLSAAFGIGAISTALSLPHQLKARSLNRVVSSGFILYAVSAVLIATADYTVLALAGAFCAGAAWVGVFASLSAATQSVAPAWVRARAVAMSMVAVMASIAIGSAIWGTMATGLGTRIALATSAGVLMVLLIVNRRFRVKLGEEADVTPGVQLPDLSIAVLPRPDDGPVLIQLEYRIDREQRDEFLRAAYAVEPVRRRNGVSDWRIFRDLGEDGRFIERFVIMSWAEYVRLRTRMTVADRRLQDHLETFQRPGEPVRVSRLIGINPHDVPAPGARDHAG